MLPFPTWEVDLNVYGPITGKGIIRLQEQKGNNLPIPFQSDVRIKAIGSGVQITNTAYAANTQHAKKVSLIFIGYMIDALTLEINLPIYLSYNPTQSVRSEGFNERRIISRQEWHRAFSVSRFLSVEKPAFLRALGWYRK